MEIISHRGYWLSSEEKNAPVAFHRSFNLGFGTETDVRDCAGKLLVSHDPPVGTEISLEDLLEIAGAAQPTLALNVKADGLASKIADVMRHFQYRNWFVFDMSIPDTRMQISAGNPTYVRYSEVEQTPAYLDNAVGIWLDAFETDDWRIPVGAEFLHKSKHVCLVSPELHKRPHLPFWTKLLHSDVTAHERLILCTDFPEQARDFFRGKA